MPMKRISEKLFFFFFFLIVYQIGEDTRSKLDMGQISFPVLQQLGAVQEFHWPGAVTPGQVHETSMWIELVFCPGGFIHFAWSE